MHRTKTASQVEARHAIASREDTGLHLMILLTYSSFGYSITSRISVERVVTRCGLKMTDH